MGNVGGRGGALQNILGFSIGLFKKSVFLAHNAEKHRRGPFGDLQILILPKKVGNAFEKMFRNIDRFEGSSGRFLLQAPTKIKVQHAWIREKIFEKISDQ